MRVSKALLGFLLVYILTNVFSADSASSTAATTKPESTTVSTTNTSAATPAPTNVSHTETTTTLTTVTTTEKPTTSESTTIPTTTMAAPMRPETVTIKAQTNDSIKLFVTNDGDYHGLQILYNGQSKNISWNENQIATLDNLQAGTEYNISVYSYYGSKFSTSSFDLTAVTVPSKPYPPKAERVSMRNFTMSWLKNEEEEVDYYNVSVALGNSQLIWKRVNNTGTEDLTVVISDNINPGQCYNVSVQAVNSGGSSEAATSTVCTVPSKPNSLKITSVFVGNFSISWSQNEEVEYYNVSVAHSNTQLVWKRVNKADTGNLTVVISDNINPGQCYNVSVQAVNSGGSSEAATSTVCTVPSKPNPPIIENVFVGNFSISWSKPEEEKVEYYNVSVAHSNKQWIWERVNKTDTGDLTVVISGNIYPGQCYNVSVQAVNSGGSSEAATSTVCTVPSKPGSITIKNVTVSDFSVSWSTNEEEIEYYRLYVVHGNNNVTSKRVNKTCTGNLSVVISGNIDPGQCYNVSVQAVNNWSSSEAATSTVCTVPSKPNSLTIKSVFMGNFSISWSQNEEEVEYYNVSVAHSNKHWIWERVNKTGTEDLTVVISDNIDPGQCYNVGVQAVNSGGSSEAATSTVCTVPSKPGSITIKNVTVSDFSVSWSTNEEEIEYYRLYVVHGNNNVTSKRVNKTCTGDLTVVISDNIDPGQCYNVSVQAVNSGGSSEAATSTVCTVPSIPGGLHIGNITTNSFSVSWLNKRNETIDWYISSASLCNSSKDNPITSNVSGKVFSLIFNENIAPGQCYLIKIFAINSGGTGGANTSTIYTKPEISQVNIAETSSRYFIVNIAIPANGHVDRYVFNLAGGNINKTFEESACPCNITMDIKPATNYSLNVMAISGDMQSKPFVVDLRTKPEPPGKVQMLHTTSLTQNTIHIEWEPPQNSNGEVIGYIVSINASTTNKGYENITDPKGQSFTFSNLTPGTCYEIGIIVMNEKYNGSSTTIFAYTKETVPGPVNNVTVTNINSSAVNVLWDKPNEPNGLIIGYAVTVQHIIGSCLERITVLCKDCKATCGNTKREKTEYYDKFPIDIPPCMKNTTISLEMGRIVPTNVKVKELSPYTNYNFTVYAITEVGYGGSFSKFHQTAEDMPSAVLNVTAQHINAHTAEVRFEEPRPPNGVILHYDLTYEFIVQSCPLMDMMEKLNKTININATLVDETNLKWNLPDLHPYWKYTLLMRARTKCGNGPWSKPYSFMTNQAEPGQVDIGGIKEINSTPYTVELQWQEPCPLNGIISKYTIKWMNTTKNTHNYYTTSDGNITNKVIAGLVPDTTYTFRIAAETIVQGNYSLQKPITTPIDKPRKPYGVKIIKKHAKSLSVTWNEPELRTGPTTYDVTATDNVTGSVVSTCNTMGFSNVSCTIEGLDEFWYYSIKVTAKTVKGRSSSDEYVINRTASAAPGRITDLVVTLETNVTLPRTMTVTWKEPIERDRNGIITNYCVTSQTISKCVDSSQRSVILSVEPGVIYKFIVFAQTNCSGQAPPKPNQTSTEKIIQTSSSSSVSDDKTQIKVVFSKDFLCDDRNGVPTAWYVIVSASSKATDSPFWGSKNEYISEKIAGYGHWKDTEDPSPYIASDKLKPQCHSHGKRRLLEVGQNNNEFTIGDKSCTEDYCNGKLHPDSSYRAKVGVCTNGGCVETEYSVPIKTAPNKAPIIAASTVVVIVVLIAVTGTIFFMRRRHLVCFKEKAIDDDFTTIEMSQKASRPIPIASFADHCENMKKDAKLLFSEEYGTLKSMSPVHSTSCAEAQGVRIKNRYTNILAFDHSRVKLLPLDEDDGSDYINANYIPGYHSQREYIATQGPIACTKDDFWRMIWEQNVNVIVMLTQIVERGRRKCELYWPETVKEPVFFGDLMVELESESTLPDYVIRVINIGLGNVTRKIKHFYYLSWPDMGTPKTTECMIQFIKDIRKHTNPSMTGPFVVHCSAGVGRTGTYIALDQLIEKHSRNYCDVDIFGLVLKLRNERVNMVQTEDQYVFIHECIRDFLLSGSDSSDESEEGEPNPIYENV